MLVTMFEIVLVAAWLACQAVRLLFWLVKTIWELTKGSRHG